jgi:glycosyltransferase involved in cell wall biosynthesis
MWYELPARLGATKVTTIAAESRDEYLLATSAANVFLAPRAAEGIGLTFLEAMARGGAVIAYDAPTMNEYIRNGDNGILLKPEPVAGQATLVSRFREALFADRNPHLLSHRQDWANVEALGMEAVGGQARADCRVGQMKWREDIRSYASFVSDW